MFKRGHPIPDPVDLPDWGDEWSPFGDTGCKMRKVTGDEEINCDIFLFYGAQNTFMDAHNHIPSESITVLSGALRIEVEWTPGEWTLYDLTAGMTLSIPSRVMHRAEYYKAGYVVLSYVPGFKDEVWAVEKS